MAKEQADLLRERAQERREELRDRVQERRIKVRERVDVRLDALRERAQERRETIRERFQERREEIRERVKDRREHIRDLRENFREHRKAFLEARKDVRELCREDPQSQECLDAKAELLADGQLFLGNAVDQIITHLENLKERLDANQHVDADAAAEMSAQLDASITALTDLQAQLEDADINATKEIAAELRAEWKIAHVRARLANGLLWIGRFGVFLEHVDTMEGRLTEARDELAADGEDVSEIDVALESFRAHIDAANAQHVDTQARYVDGIGDVTTNEEASARISAAKDGLRVARDELKDAREDVRTIVRLIRTLNSDVLIAASAALSADWLSARRSAAWVTFLTSSSTSRACSRLRSRPL